MDIGTGKPTRDDLMILPHQGIDLLDPGIFFSVYQYFPVVMEGLRLAANERRVPWICGGTGLYIRAVIEGLPLGAHPRPALRARLLQLLAARGAREVALALGLSVVDPDNPMRVLRATENACSDALCRQRIYAYAGLEQYGLADDEICDATAGEPEAGGEFEQARRELAEWRCAGIAVLDPGHDELQARIERRVRGMFEQGLVEETAELRRLGYGDTAVVRQGIGYREAGTVLDGNMSREDAASQAVVRTRQYAKRQRTYFRGRGWPFLRPEQLDAWADSLEET